mmetsp:Transcript_15654/g.36270  ORF Transcript_15654/g.36270 Transcript_15654/m.36270 type:complete len:222 (-) Transcript_15654:2368-3033(-)
MDERYSRGKIYTIRCRTDDTLIYVGTTIETRLSARFAKHKTQISLYKYINDPTNNTTWDDWYIELHELYPCTCRMELGKREGEVIRELATINKVGYGTPETYKVTQKIYRDTNKEHLAEHRKIYYDNNKENFVEKNKFYRNENKEHLAELAKIYQKNNKEHIVEHRKIYYEINKKDIAKKHKFYRDDNKEQANIYRNANKDKMKIYNKAYYENKNLEKIDF